MIRNPFTFKPQSGLDLISNVASSMVVNRFLKRPSNEKFSFGVIDKRVKLDKLFDVGNKSVSQTKTMPMYKKRKVMRKNKVATVAAVKRMVNGVLEKKQRSYAPSVSSFARDSIFCHNITAQVAQGTTDGSRVGDQINLTKLTGNVTWFTDTEAAFYTLRVIVGFSGEEFNPSATAFAAGLTSSDLFVGTPTTPNPIYGAIINLKTFTVLYDNIIDINSANNGFEDGNTTRFNISLPKGRFSYQSGGSVYGKTRNLYAVIVGTWVSSNVDPPEHIGSVLANMVLHYTDA